MLEGGSCTVSELVAEYGVYPEGDLRSLPNFIQSLR